MKQNSQPWASQNSCGSRAASAGWFTAFAIEAAANVRTLGLVELLFAYLVSLKLFRERLSRLEMAGMGLIALGIVGVTLGR